MSPRSSLFVVGFIALLSRVAKASMVDTCSSGLAGSLVPVISTCVPAQTFCSSRYPQSYVTTTITGSNTITQTASTSTDSHSTTTTVTVTAIDVTATALTVTVTSSTVTVSVSALTTTTTTTSTSTAETTSVTGTATCPPFNGPVGKRWAPTPSLPPNCRRVSSTTTITTTTQDPCSSVVSVLSSGAPSDASTVCDCFATPVTETETTTPTVTTIASTETTIIITVTSTVTPTDTVTPTVTLHPTVTVTPAPSTYTSTVTTTTTTTIDTLQYDSGQVTGSSSCGCVYLVTCGIKPAGSPYNSYTSPSIQACVDDCSNSATYCHGASFQISNSRCSFYSQSLNGGSDNTDFVYIALYYCNNGSCY